MPARKTNKGKEVAADSVLEENSNLAVDTFSDVPQLPESNYQSRESIEEVANAMMAAFRSNFDTAIHDMFQRTTQQVDSILKSFSEANRKSSDDLTSQVSKLMVFLAELGPINNIEPINTRNQHHPTIRTNPLQYGKVQNLNRPIMVDNYIPNIPIQSYLSREDVVEILREQLGTTYRPMVDMAYSSPYPNYIDHLYEFPENFKFPTFTLFSGEDQISTREHIGRFTAQCRQVATYDFLKLRLFSSSLTRSAFEWYINLPQNSIRTWQEMEKVFHAQFYSAEIEITLVDLARMYQEPSENVEKYINRFKVARNKCRTTIFETDCVKMALQGLKLENRKKFIGQDFIDLFHLVTSVSKYEKVLEEENRSDDSYAESFDQNSENEQEFAETEIEAEYGY